MKLKAGQVYTKKSTPMGTTNWMTIRRILSFEDHTYVIYKIKNDLPIVNPLSKTRAPRVQELDEFLDSHKGWTLT